MRRAIVDTGPLVAFLDRTEKNHHWVVEQVEELDRRCLSASLYWPKQCICLHGIRKDRMHCSNSSKMEHSVSCFASMRTLPSSASCSRNIGTDQCRLPMPVSMPASLFGALDALAVDGSRGGASLSFRLLAAFDVEPAMNAIEHAVALPK